MVVIRRPYPARYTVGGKRWIGAARFLATAVTGVVGTSFGRSSPGSAIFLAEQPNGLMGMLLIHGAQRVSGTWSGCSSLAVRSRLG